MDNNEGSSAKKKSRNGMDAVQFDPHPRVIDVTQFVEARALEITQLLAVVDNATLPKGEVAQGPRTFVQRLPRHMRRRAMSYNIRRLPRRIRPMAEATIRGSKHRKKPPSRRWRRRPRNLLNAYARRQRRVQWMETHIWHAKRFHMMDYHGWRVANRSCQRGYRATYRDAVGHCVVRDISHNVCLELCAPEWILMERLATICDKRVSQTFGNTRALAGTTEGRAIIYEPCAYPYGCIGAVRFVYRPKTNDGNRTLWIWTDPAIETKVTAILVELFGLARTDDEQKSIVDEAISFETIGKYHLSKLFSPTTYRSTNDLVDLRVLKHHLNRFRLIGPKTNRILDRVLREPPKPMDVVTKFGIEPGRVDEQWDEWKTFYSRMNPGRIDSGRIVSLIATDPRLFTDYKKRLPDEDELLDGNPPPSNAINIDSPLWSPDVRRSCLETKLSDHELNGRRQTVNRNASDLVANSANGEINSIPIMLIHQQSSSSDGDRIGMGAGWDLIVPAGWAMPFWIALQYATARAVGHDFPNHFSLESGDQSMTYPRLYWPDTEAGAAAAKTESDELEAAHLRKPTNRRVDYERLRITHPFRCPWRELVDGWCSKESKAAIDSSDGRVYVLRDRIELRKLESALVRGHSNAIRPVANGKPRNIASDDARRTTLDRLCEQHPRALVSVRLTSIGKGVPKPRALICLPTKEDLAKLRLRWTLNEPESMATVPKLDDAIKSRNKAERTPANTSIDEVGFISLSSTSTNRKRHHRETELDLDVFFEDKNEMRAVERKKKEKETKKRRKLATKSTSSSSAKNRVKAASSENLIDSCQRRIIGYACNGDFSFAVARGRAQGFCSLFALREYERFLTSENETRCFVLYRNQRSKYYRAALLNISK